MRGQMLFWQIAADSKNKGETMVVSVPAFERAVMLLEHEHRYRDAVRMCKEANEWEINTDWYTKRIVKLNKKIYAFFSL